MTPGTRARAHPTELFFRVTFIIYLKETGKEITTIILVVFLLDYIRSLVQLIIFNVIKFYGIQMTK